MVKNAHHFNEPGSDIYKVRGGGGGEVGGGGGVRVRVGGSGYLRMYMYLAPLLPSISSDG